ncbi:MAG TPA: CPBP family glutamic-type intramembrane protease [Anaerohalosphaeraceae bacterium]|nr:CPBP family intramembrane metalloprotease [Phycisphaerae bacterium]HOK95959.1 CPBP family glutamic-type intramembrane protease [Anaerohalosphaeraceae bacterium]HOL30801.1 CPBP family glutamic-type intramembrane protease [Anaerohalosphaeraceae bacterium]HPC63688.1 CPBP family glutamic-type intramembrane protease [Anaerohalosphaeraceae bacterium]HPO69377.1 CPBP family glutamic-type intramembrane protease [Anaerohalosphaeraceae bacterium]
MARYYDRRAVSGQLVAFVPNSYAERTSRPIYGLVYLLGFLCLFLVGTFLIQPAVLSQSLAEPQVRVVAFVWIQNIMEYLGFPPRTALIATPLVVVFILLILQITSKAPWRIQWGDFLLMGGECILLSIPLIVLSLLLNRSNPPAGAAVNALPTPVQNQILVDMITGIGAGVFEEFIFRLVLICLLMLVFQDIFGLEKTPSIILSVAISAVLFSMHHHFFFANGHFYQGDTFTVGKFVFRAMAGVYFAVLYAVRGFGITAGTHVFYNVLAALVRTLIFMIQPDS